MDLRYLLRFYYDFRRRMAWKNRDDGSIQTYFNDIESLNRLRIVEIADQIGCDSVYEFGCYSAPNLRLLSNGGRAVFGTDINPKAIAYARLNIPNGSFMCADDSNINDIIKWLPKVDLVIINAVFYSMKNRRVIRVLSALKSKTNYFLIGCNLDNFDGLATRINKFNSFEHPYGKMLENIGNVISIFKVPKSDYALNGFILVKVK